MTLKYVLDTNVFIQAHRQWYRLTFAPGFWGFVLDQHRYGVVTSIDRVRSEIKKGDALYAWVDKTAPRSLFASSKQIAVGNKYREVINWVMTNPKYDGAAKSLFATDTDCWVIAYAGAYNLTVVSHEVPSQAKGRVKIPDVCKHFGIGYRDTFYMLEDLKISLKQ
ncbi:DUF4411 family protein [Arenimonas sp.]|uniref:DUF4411 family protein n=1 Tax=Arenimonas sp. TaxID=1872635 RepID=UPI0025E91ED3|nr:DUF4411 family protein [Arenimonas sp.]